MELEKLIDAAKQEQWIEVDEAIPKICDDPEYINWAYGEGTLDDDGNVRDLAVSILEQAQIAPKVFDGMRERLYNIMMGDDNEFVRYRCAFTFVNHGPGDYKDEVIEVLNEAARHQEQDIADMAKAYLEGLDSS